MTARYAIYHAPAVDSPWWRFGASWLGRDEQRDTAVPQRDWPDGPQAFRALTEEPRRYGFHATLKAPFRLHERCDEAVLLEQVARLARGLRRVELGALVPARISDFIALVPQGHRPHVDALAAECVTMLDRLRAPLTPDELARRLPERLNTRARAFLAIYGYPWVLDLFRFHMTLSGPVDEPTGHMLIEFAARDIAPLNAQHPMAIERLCVFREDSPGAAFRRIHDEPLQP